MKINLKSVVFLALPIVIAGCQNKQQEETVEVTTKSGITVSDFQTAIDDDSTSLYVLQNNNGMEVTVTNFGGRIVSVMVPDKDGNLKDVVLGYDNIDDYIAV